MNYLFVFGPFSAGTSLLRTTHSAQHQLPWLQRCDPRRADCTAVCGVQGNVPHRVHQEYPGFYDLQGRGNVSAHARWDVVLKQRLVLVCVCVFVCMCFVLFCFVLFCVFVCFCFLVFFFFGFFGFCFVFFSLAFFPANVTYTQQHRGSRR